VTTILIAAQQEDVQNLLPWAAHISASRNADLILLLTQRKTGETRFVDLQKKQDVDESEFTAAARIAVQDLIAKSANHSELPAPVSVRLLQIVGERWADDVAAKLQELKPTLLIVPAPTISKDQSASDDWQTSLLSAVDCDVILMRDDDVCLQHQLRAAVFLTDNADNEAALMCVSKLVDSVGGAATAVYIEPKVGDDAVSVGRHQLRNELKRSLRTSDRDLFKHRVIVAGSIDEAFREISPGDFDILLMGTRDLVEMRRFLQASHAKTTKDSVPLPAVAVIKKGESLSNRLLSRVDRRLRAFVPQLSRTERVELVSRIQDSSKWDFDFIFLISLATLIACFGLAENSGAVIVGAMLVAPLMTPIAGVGLGVAHANAFLTKVAFRTAVRGFATAVILGILFGLCVQGCSYFNMLDSLQVATHSDLPDANDATVSVCTFPQEMENRTRPQFYDLLIALTSGVAAAYAMGRPNLFSALPGVAIAAALVPPIATSGIAFAYGDFAKGGGALLLFLTNMVAIILGTSLIFRAVGVRSQKEGADGARWPRHVLLLLVLLSVLITVVIEFNNRAVSTVSNTQ
jgi:uncharacterized hydrophobic protein (TIGR00271 family)